MNFSDRLASATSRNDSFLCLGLDPYGVDPKYVSDLNRAVIDSTSDLVCAYKPNLAIYDSMGQMGLAALKETVDAVPSDMPVIGDGKRGDIANCGKSYAESLFSHYRFDAVTMNPYMGSDVVKPFWQTGGRDKAIFVLCRTSNESGSELQLLDVLGEDGATRKLYLEVARLAERWGPPGSIGYVVGATFPQDLSAVRAQHPDAVLLIPGVGTQGGSVQDSVKAAVDRRGRGFTISVSRDIMFAHPDGPDGVRAGRLTTYAKAARSAAIRYRDEINRALELVPA